MDPSDSAPHCPVCAAPLRRPVRECPSCGTQHHAECWKYIGGCAIYACVMRAEPPRMQAVAPVEIGKTYTPMFSLNSLLVVLVLGGMLAGLFLPAYADARKRSHVTGCKSNMKQLGIYLNTYLARYGDDSLYPTNKLPAGVDAHLAARGTNGAFWTHLWALPNQRESVSKRPGDNGLYRCGVYGGAYSGICLDYSGPNLANTSAFPDGKLSDRVLGDTYISGDLILPGDCNHGCDDEGPNYDFNGLRFDGSVQNIVPSRSRPLTGEFGKYVQSTDATTGIRTR